MNDVELNSAGDLQVNPRYISGLTLVAQRVRLRLLTHRGEWFLDQRLGVPYILWKDDKPPVASMRSVIRRILETTPGVISVASLSVEYQGRKVLISGRLRTPDGELTISEAY